MWRCSCCAGRGTAAADGLAIAQAVLEELCRLDCRLLFATHFAELAAVPQATPHTLEVLTDNRRDVDDEPIFTYRVVPGVAYSSFGLHTARIAGIPPHVVRRAAELLRSRR